MQKIGNYQIIPINVYQFANTLVSITDRVRFTANLLHLHTSQNSLVSFDKTHHCHYSLGYVRSSCFFLILLLNSKKLKLYLTT